MAAVGVGGEEAAWTTRLLTAAVGVGGEEAAWTTRQWTVLRFLHISFFPNFWDE